MSRLSRDLQKIPTLRILIPYVSGLFIAENFPLELSPLRIIGILTAIMALSIICFHSREFLFKVSVTIFFFAAGFFTTILVRKPVPEFNAAQETVVSGLIVSSPEVNGELIRFEIESCSMVRENGIDALKTLLLGYLRSDSTSNEFSVGALYHFCGKLYPIRNGGNPGEFDYAGYMAAKGCYYRLYIDSVLATGYRSCNRFNLRGKALSVKNRIIAGWKGSQDDLGTLKAIVMGDKTDLTDETRHNYARSGAMHILAVSGLHVGLIWIVLQRLFFFMVLIPGGRWVRSTLIVAILWFYALMAGLSPSVCRSVSMFSLFTISSAINREGNSMNILLLTALILLNINPARIGDVGFQLSYLAVAGIILFQPILSGKIGTRSKFIRRILELTIVSLSAQLATAPLSIFYFHQFPLYFIITNLLAIPLLSIIVSVFIVASPLFLLDIPGEFIIRILLGLTHLMNELMNRISGLPGAAIQGISFNNSEMVLTLLLVLLLYLYMRYQRVIFLIQFMILTALLSIDFSLEGFRKINERQMTVGNFRGGSLITFAEGGTSHHFISTEDSVSGSFMMRYIENAWQDKGFQTYIHAIDDLWFLQDKVASLKRLDDNIWLIGNAQINLLFLQGFIDQDAVEFCERFPVNMLVLSKINYAGIKADFNTESDLTVIIDGSNRISADQMKTLTDRSGTITTKDGAYVKSY